MKAVCISGISTPGKSFLADTVVKNFSFPGIYLLFYPEETVLKRRKLQPRWRSDSQIQARESPAFFYLEQTKYKEESEKSGFKTLTNIDEAEKNNANSFMSFLNHLKNLQTV